MTTQFYAINGDSFCYVKENGKLRKVSKWELRGRLLGAEREVEKLQADNEELKVKIEKLKVKIGEIQELL